MNRLVFYVRREMIRAALEDKKSGQRSLLTFPFWVNPTLDEIVERGLVPLYTVHPDPAPAEETE